MESKFKKGSRVSHPKYGTGTVASINLGGDRCHIRRDKDDEVVNLLIEELTLLDAPEQKYDRAGNGTTILPTVEQKYDRAGIAAMAMQGLCSIDWDIKTEPIEDTLANMVAWQAVKCADALIAELKRTEK